MFPLPHPTGSVLAARASRRREQHQKLSQGEDGELKGSEVLVNALTLKFLSIVLYSLLPFFFHLTSASNLTVFLTSPHLVSHTLVTALSGRFVTPYISFSLARVKKIGDCFLIGEKCHMESYVL